MDVVGHGKVVLAAVFGGKGSVKALDYIAQRLTEDHFEDRAQQVLYILARRYADQTTGILPRHALEDVLRASPPGTALQYAEYYDLLIALRPTLADFRHSVDQLRELHSVKLTGNALAQGKEILERGAMSNGVEVRGSAAARMHVVAAFASAEREAALGESPEGDIRAETEKVHAAYAAARERRVSGQSAGIGTGIERLDDALSGGLADGEFALIAAYANAGKSQWCAHQAWHTSVVEGKNVVLFASETTRANMMVRILGRHSRLPKFGLPAGLNTRDIRAGTLNGEEYRAFRAVLDDYRTVAGRCYIVQLPKGWTMGSLEGRLAAVARQFTPDLVIIDYLGLGRPDRQSARERRDDLAMLLQDAKQLAVTFRDGRGVPVISPWQVNRDGRKEAKQRGYYIMGDLAETAEAERSPDVIITLLEPETDDTRGRRVPLRLDVVKNRENERFVRVDLTADFANSYFTADGADGESLLSPLMQDEM